MIDFIKRVVLTILSFVVGTIILVMLLSLFTDPIILPDGSSVLPQWTIFVLLIYWIFIFTAIWKSTLGRIKDKLYGLKSVFIINSEVEDFRSHSISEEQITLMNSDDPLLYEVANFVIETERASTSNLQRRFALGYNRAAHLIDILEFSGIVGKANQSMPRNILSKDLKLLVDYLSINKSIEKYDNHNDERLKSIIKDPVLFSNDHIFYKILKYVIEVKMFNVDEIQSLFNLNFALTSQYTNTLKLLGILDENMDYILSDSESYESIYDYIKFAYYSNSEYVSSLNLDMLNNGFEFESFIGNLLSKNSYIDVIVTQASNDYGIDVTATKDGIKYAIQCKYYTSTVGNSSVQEVTAGKNHYNAHVGVVATNNYFTKNAIELAKSNNIILWDRDKILSMIKQ